MLVICRYDNYEQCMHSVCCFLPDMTRSANSDCVVRFILSPLSCGMNDYYKYVCGDPLL